MDLIEPVDRGVIDRDGIGIAWETYGTGGSVVTFPPVFNIAHSRLWKAQVPWLARHMRVVTIDPRGNGRSDRPADPEQFDPFVVAGDVVAALDAAGVERTVLVGNSFGSLYSVLVATVHPERVAGIVHIGTAVNLTGDYGDPLSRALLSFEQELDEHEGWSSFNMHAWRRDWKRAAEFFVEQAASDAHSGRPREDGLEWALEADPASTTAMMRRASRDYRAVDAEKMRALVVGLDCPQLVMHGTHDNICPYSWGEALADALGVTAYTIEGGGHCPQVRYPALVNEMIRDFVAEVAGAPHATISPRQRSVHAPGRPRVLYLSSPIGLGHVRRDLAIAEELRALAPDVEIDWLAQDPVSRFLEDRGQTIHPASRHLAGESAFLEGQAGEHDLFVFEAYRRMDTLLVNNFGVFRDLMDDEHYDLVIGDESWEVDLFLHEHPELKQTRFAWLTDFVGWLPMPAGGERDKWYAADYNTWMIENVERHPDIRDAALFVGDPGDVVDRRFGPRLPYIDEWVGEHYEFCGYVTGFESSEIADREALRNEFGFGDDETIVIAAVGGTAVGAALLQRIVAAHSLVRREVQGLRTIAVSGPRIDPESLPDVDGVERVAFVPDLHRRLAAADLAVVQGGLTTTMELTAAGRPFLYFPLQNHFEQQIHVRHRLDRHRAGTALDYSTATTDLLAEEILSALGGPTDYEPVSDQGARRAAEAISGLL